MKYVVDGKEFEVIINKKNNKNTYIKIENSKIIVNTNYLVDNIYIKKLLDNNYDIIKKMLERDFLKQQKNNSFYYLGNKYDIIVVNYCNIEINNNKIFVKSIDYLNKWLKKQTEIIFKERLDYIYNLFEEEIPYPKLKTRKMKTRWGVCSKNNSITLNSELIKYNYEQIDYVIIHELSHFIYFDHSKNFWNLVSKYCNNYKEIRKSLK